MLIELIVLLGIGGFLCIMGLRIWKNHEGRLINDYHYKNVAPENRKAYSEQVGKGVLLIGGGLITNGVLDFITDTSAGWVCTVLAFVFGFAIMIKAQRKYSGTSM